MYITFKNMGKKFEDRSIKKKQMQKNEFKHRETKKDNIG